MGYYRIINCYWIVLDAFIVYSIGTRDVPVLPFVEGVLFVLFGKTFQLLLFPFLILENLSLCTTSRSRLVIQCSVPRWSRIVLRVVLGHTFPNVHIHFCPCTRFFPRPCTIKEVIPKIPSVLAIGKISSQMHLPNFWNQDQRPFSISFHFVSYDRLRGEKAFLKAQS